VGRAECDDWQTEHPDWIFCDDFEAGGALDSPGRYFEYVDNDGEFVPLAGAGVDASIGMRVRWQTGEVDAGNLKVAFGRNPVSYMNMAFIRTRTFGRSTIGCTSACSRVARQPGQALQGHGLLLVGRVVAGH